MLRRAISLTVLLALTGSVTAAAQAPVATDSAAAGSAATDPAADSAAALQFGQKASGWLWAAEVDSLWANLDEESRTTLGSPDNIANQVLEFVGRFGAETTVVREALTRQGENYRYTRVVHLEAAEEPWTMVWTMAPDLRVMDLDLQPGG